MSPSFTQAVEALTAQAQTLIAATTAEVDALREELEQERRFRRHLEANAAARAHEVAAQQEEARRVRERLEAELAEAHEGRRLAEAEVERFHEAVRQQLAIAEQEQAALEEAERERDRLRQEAADRQCQALTQELEQEQQARFRLERRLSGVRQAVLDLLEPQDDEGEGAGPGIAADLEQADAAARLSLRKILVPRSTSQDPQPVLG
jgi:DNA repair exonuclease SbcCD ATPase subunit